MNYPVVTYLLFFCQWCDQSLGDLHATCVIVSDPWWSIMEVSLTTFCISDGFLVVDYRKFWIPSVTDKYSKTAVHSAGVGSIELATDLTCVFRDKYVWVQIRSTSFQWKCWKGEWGSFLHNNRVDMEHRLMHSTCICGSDHGNYDWLRQSRCFSLKLILSLVASPS